MANPRHSHWKTVCLAALLLLSGLVLLALLAGFAWTRQAPWTIAVWLLWALSVLPVGAASGWVALVVLGGLLALRRDALEEHGVPYVATRRREATLGVIGTLYSWLRRLLAVLRRGSALYLRPGELVEVRSLEEILQTLDEVGTLNGLPFMPEMTAFCGHRFRVLRRVEKLNDYVWKRGLRRMHDLVLLEGLRCDGGFHGGCQANCQLRWNEAWLRRAAGSDAPLPAGTAKASTAGLPVLRTTEGEERFVCQVTELTANSAPLSWSDPRVYLRELLVGNVRLRPFLVGISLMVFRWVQLKRGGVGFPLIQPGAGKTSPEGGLDLRPGELVRVKRKREIEPTLNEQLCNRGLKFDGEMLRYCGGEYRVLARLQRLIIEKTGKLVRITNPSVLLDGTTATGEYAAFNAENEHIFWREIWLERVETVGRK